MKFLTLILLATALNVFACPGGRILLNEGKVALYADFVQEKFSDDVAETPVNEMKDRDLVVVFETKFPDRDSSKKTTISVEDIKQDSKGIIHTDYKIETNWTYLGNPSSKIEYWRVNSNYVGGGVSAKGMGPRTEYEITRYSNCSNRD